MCERLSPWEWCGGAKNGSLIADLKRALGLRARLPIRATPHMIRMISSRAHRACYVLTHCIQACRQRASW
jgi:hypothetical protein